MNKKDREMVPKVLRVARDVLARKGWAQGYLALGSHGGIISPLDPKACRFCAVGALEYSLEKFFDSGWCRISATALERREEVFGDARRLLFEMVPKADEVYGCLEHYNDHCRTTKEDILALFDRAIERAEQHDE